jgi:hypothetical protein
MNPAFGDTMSIDEWYDEVNKSWDLLGLQYPFSDYMNRTVGGLYYFDDYFTDALIAISVELPSFEQEELSAEELTTWYKRTRAARRLFIHGFVIFNHESLESNETKLKYAERAFIERSMWKTCIQPLKRLYE